MIAAMKLSQTGVPPGGIRITRSKFPNVKGRKIIPPSANTSAGSSRNPLPSVVYFSMRRAARLNTSYGSGSALNATKSIPAANTDTRTATHQVKNRLLSRVISGLNPPNPILRPDGKRQDEPAHCTAPPKIFGGSPGASLASGSGVVRGGRKTISRVFLTRPLPLSFLFERARGYSGTGVRSTEPSRGHLSEAGYTGKDHIEARRGIAHCDGTLVISRNDLVAGASQNGFEQLPDLRS
jgi:hypothetical protein